MINAIDHIGILTNDLEKSVKFYTDVLGFSIAMKMEMEETGLSVVFVEKAGSKIELMEYRGWDASKSSKGVEIAIGGSSIPVNDHTSFSVDNIAETVNEFKEKGVIFNLEPVELEGGMKLAYFKDPDGLLIELVEHA